MNWGRRKVVETLRRRIARSDRVTRCLASKLPGVGPGTEDGFTLIELVIVMIIIPIIIGGVTTAIIVSLQNQNVEYHRIADSVDPQIASAYFTRDIQSASQITTAASPACGSNGTPLLSLTWSQTISRTITDGILSANTLTLSSAGTPFTQQDITQLGSLVTVTDVDGDIQPSPPASPTEIVSFHPPSGAPTSNSVTLSQVAAGTSTPADPDTVTITRTLGPWLVTYWAEPDASDTNTQIVRSLCYLEDGNSPVADSSTIVARDLPLGQTPVATITCGPTISNCNPSNSLPAAGITSVSLSAAEPASAYSFSLLAAPRSSDSSSEGVAPGGNPFNPTSLLLLGAGKGTLNLTSPSTKLDVTGTMAFNCTSCDPALVDLDAVDTTVTESGGLFQVAQNQGSQPCPCAVVSTNMMAGATSSPSTASYGLPAPTATVLPPASSTGGCTQPSPVQSPHQWTCTPGVYSNPSTFSSNGATFTLAPGVYTFSQGLNVTANNNSIIGTGGVFFYVPSGQVAVGTPNASHLDRQLTVQLSPETSGPYDGIVLYQAPSDTSPIELWANNLGTNSQDSLAGQIEATGAPISIVANSSLISIGSIAAVSLTLSSSGPTACTASQQCQVDITG
jgi:prepilin-type N-terminal cleavage/methylation domain-containing protein